ncbi:MAG TPA: hypothetical protein DDW76_00095 [Cyanobacteria bacterium UBA11369]|nr:hypothetical protein [Cyanobacteria bacterium UBA11369]
MRVKVPPTRLRYDSLSAHIDQTRYLEDEAGNRAQPDIYCGMALALVGNSQGEVRARKSNLDRSGAQEQNPDLIGVNSRSIFYG